LSSRQLRWISWQGLTTRSADETLVVLEALAAYDLWREAGPSHQGGAAKVGRPGCNIAGGRPRDPLAGQEGGGRPDGLGQEGPEAGMLARPARHPDEGQESYEGQAEQNQQEAYQ
jgi:hypothetical protein